MSKPNWPRPCTRAASCVGKTIPRIIFRSASVPGNLATPKSPKAAAILKDIGTWFLFLPRSPPPLVLNQWRTKVGCSNQWRNKARSPDLNLIEINRMLSRTHGVRILIFAKLKTLIRKAAARTCDQLWKAVGHVCDLFTEEECCNFFKAAGYETD